MPNVSKMPISYIARVIILVIGLFLMAFGVVLSIHSALGTSPISSLPYTLSFIFNMSVGMLTILMHIVMILLQMLLLQKNFQWHQWLQLPVGLIFGLMIDALMWLTQAWQIQIYSLQIAMCLLSCLFTALGVCFVIQANLVFLAGEGLYAAVSQRFKISFGKCKTYGDLILVFIAVIISAWMLSEIVGVREGTIISALLVGTMVKFLLEKFKRFHF